MPFQQTTRARFSLVAEREDQVLLRVINQFVQRGVGLDRVCAIAGVDRMDIVVQCARLPNSAATLIAERLRSLVLVSDVRLDFEADEPSDDTVRGQAA